MEGFIDLLKQHYSIKYTIQSIVESMFAGWIFENGFPILGGRSAHIKVQEARWFGKINMQKVVLGVSLVRNGKVDKLDQCPINHRHHT